MRELSADQPGLRPSTAWSFLGCGAALVGLYLAVPAAWPVIFLVVPVTAVAAIVHGARRNERPGRRRPWYAIAAALACFLGGSLLRLVTPGVDGGAAALVPDLLTVPGYLLFGWALLDMLRRRGGTGDGSARSDAVLIGIAAALTVWAFLLAPAIGAESTGGVVPLAAAAFPLIDVFLLVLVSRLLLAEGSRQPALWLVACTTAEMLAIDLVFALSDDTAGSGLWLTVFDVLYLLGNITAGAAALHPTMRGVTESQQVVTRAFRPARVIGILAVLIVPTVLAYAVPAPTRWNMIVRVLLTVLLAVTVIARIVRAHNSQAYAEAAARHRSTHDALTDLPNRELLSDTIRSWAGRADADGLDISLLFLDLDRFKQVNDTWGHHVGDELLCAVGARLSAIVRGEDLVCRIGGDEFVIALASPHHGALAASLAQRVVGEFARPFALSVGDVFVTPSIGVARSAGAPEALALIRDADTAMYQAKDAGRNTVAYFDTELRDRSTARVALEQALRGAAERGELSVHYQPIVALGTDTRDGFEALMRWERPGCGPVPPLDFIPIAEDTGLINTIGAWLLEESVDQLARWRRDDPDLHVSVNISTRQLRDGSLVEIVRAALDRAGLPASALWLEITESVMIEDSRTALETLRQLSELGVTLCIDDFGTGYASLSYVRHLPAGIVKVDRSFVRGLGQDRGDEAIVLSVIAMAHALGQQVVAEGVETTGQRDWLRTHGCDLVQGYLYDRPKPADQIQVGAGVR
jgi:diguanylate cyclase (GGDEF)-like protein